MTSFTHFCCLFIYGVPLLHHVCVLEVSPVFLTVCAHHRYQGVHAQNASSRAGLGEKMQKKKGFQGKVWDFEAIFKIEFGLEF